MARRPISRRDNPEHFRGRQGRITAICGGDDMKLWLLFSDQIETYAKRKSCKRVRICGHEAAARSRRI
jgi:hypothetical protein